MHASIFLALLQDAPAGGAPAGGAAPTSSLFDLVIPMVLCLAVFWFVMINPERKARKKLEEMRGALKKGDKVILSSGLHGTVAQVQEGVVTLQVDEGVRLKYAVAAIQSVIEPAATTEK
ncbi:MAG: preprotein translocase subunit YajC [Planctomycetes bacterium]|nr:preprotein translocase subunit YajC [Planctomycetota bacterium]